MVLHHPAQISDVLRNGDSRGLVRKQERGVAGQRESSGGRFDIGQSRKELLLLEQDATRVIDLFERLGGARDSPDGDGANDEYENRGRETGGNLRA